MAGGAKGDDEGISPGDLVQHVDDQHALVPEEIEATSAEAHVLRKALLWSESGPSFLHRGGEGVVFLDEPGISEEAVARRASLQDFNGDFHSGPDAIEGGQKMEPLRPGLWSWMRRGSRGEGAVTAPGAQAARGGDRWWLA